MPVDVLRGAMSSVHYRLAGCEQRNGGHLEDVILRVEWSVSRPLIHLFLQMLKYVLPYKCNSIMKSNTFNFLLTLKNRTIRWQTLYTLMSDSHILKICKFFHSCPSVVGLGIIIVEVSRAHSDTHTQKDSSSWVIGPSQRPLPKNK